MRTPSLRRLAAYVLPALALPAIAAALLWLLPTDSARAQDGAKITISGAPTIVSTPAEQDFYAAGESIEVALNFTAPVTVTSNEKTGGPRLRVRVGDQLRWARYARSDQEGARLIFAYTVKNGQKDVDDDGVSVPKNSLKLAGGVIADSGDNPAELKHGRLPNQAGHLVNAPNAAPSFQYEGSGSRRFDRYIPELSAAGVAVGARVAPTDPDDQVTYVDAPIAATDPDGDRLTYSLSGADSASFNVSGDTPGQIILAPGVSLNYESNKSAYWVKITATDPRGLSASANVRIWVTNVEEPGVIALDSDQPREGTPLGAGLTDPDHVLGKITWVWERSETAQCGGEWTEVDRGKRRSGAAPDRHYYTPSAEDVGYCLRATARYDDDLTAGRSVTATAANPVEVAPPPNRAPEFPAGPTIRTIAENSGPDVNVGDPVAATDADGDGLTYAITGSDAFLVIPDTGQVFVAAGAGLDYETRSEYTVTVTVHDGKNVAGEADASLDDSVELTITLLNVDEPGTVTLSLDQPRVGSRLTASLSDVDGPVSDVTWTWSRASSSTGSYSAISGAASASYTPAAADEGMWLKATATSYTDPQGPGKSAEGVAANAALAAESTPPEPQPNAAPSFQYEVPRDRRYDRYIAELSPSGAAVGAPVTATDPDHDQLTYSLSGADAASFNVSNASGSLGQITLAEGVSLNYESNQNAYWVKLTATDPGGLTASAGVRIWVTNVEEPGVIVLDSTQPQEGTRLGAALTDPDLILGDITWVWERSGTSGCDGEWTEVDRGTRPSGLAPDRHYYTPKAADVGYCLRITASYQDDFEPEEKETRSVTQTAANPVAEEPAAQ